MTLTEAQYLEKARRNLKAAEGLAQKFIGYARDFIALGERLLSQAPNQATEADEHEE